MPCLVSNCSYAHTNTCLVGRKSLKPAKEAFYFKTRWKLFKHCMLCLSLVTHLLSQVCKSNTLRSQYIWSNPACSASALASTAAVSLTDTCSVDSEQERWLQSWRRLLPISQFGSKYHVARLQFLSFMTPLSSTLVKSGLYHAFMGFVHFTLLCFKFWWWKHWSVR